MSDTILQNRSQLRRRIVAITASLVVGIGLMLAKFAAYRITHSAAVLSDALESIINVVASLFAMFSILLSAKPPDEDHPYGHGKIEYFSAGFEGALIVLAAVGIFKVGIGQLVDPRPLPQLQSGLLILLGAGLVNLVLGIVLVRTGRKTDSLVLEADGRHVLSDVYTSGGVLLGLVLVSTTGWLWLDGAIACLVGLHIMIVGGRLVWQSVTGLMDAADPQILEQVAELLNAHRRSLWIDIHQLRAWRAGSRIHLDLHLILPRDLSLEEAHDEAKVIEQLIMEHYQHKASVLVHMDPCTDPDCPDCRRSLCELRKRPMNASSAWTANSVSRPSPSGKSTTDLSSRPPGSDP